ncbi:MAG: MMPL family transporter [Methylococcales bacterium]
MVKVYIRWVIRWRWFVVIASILAVVGAGSGGQFLLFNNDYRIFFSEENPQLKAFDVLQKTYTKSDNVLFVLAPANKQVFSREMLSTVEKLTDKAWKIPYSTRVDSITNFQHSYAVEDNLIVGDLVKNSDQLSANDLQRIESIALREPLLVNLLVSPNAQVTGVNVSIQLPEKGANDAVREIAAYVRQLAAEITAENPGLEIHLTGMLMMNNAFPESSEYDIKLLVPIMFGTIIILAGIMLKTVSGVIATLLVIVFSIFSAMGLAGWLGIALSSTSLAAPNIILTLAVADCIHILSNFLKAMRDGEAKDEALTESLRINFQPVFLATLTTTIGFLSLNFSDAPPFHDLGNITALGIITAFLLSITFLPAVVAILPIRVRQDRDLTSRSIERLGQFVIRKKRSLLLGMSALVVALVACIPANELNDEYIKYFGESLSFRRDTDFAMENLTGIYYIDYSLRSKGSGAVTEPAFLANVDAFASWYRKQPEVLHVNSITDTFKRLNRNMNGDDSSWYRLPEESDRAAQYLLLYELSLPYGLDLNDRINIDKSATRLTATLKNLSSREVLALEERAQDWLKNNAPLSMHVPGSGPTIMFAHIGQRNIESMLIGTTIALVLISFILIFAFRSFKLGLISLVPNLVPVGMAFGLWGLVVGRVGLALSVVAAMTLGIVVDDTVHFLSKYRRARNEKNMTSEQAILYSFNTVGTALCVTSVVLIAGFSVLAFSSFEINSGMGMLTAIAIGFALIADLLLLPPLLMKIERKNHETETTRLNSTTLKLSRDSS